MQAKALLIPLAAFALSATGVSAFNSDVLIQAGLTDTQVGAFESARELRKEGHEGKARELLIKSGVTLETIESIREAVRIQKKVFYEAVDAAVRSNNYDAFKEVIKSLPLADIITSKDDFEIYVQAHQYYQEGEVGKAAETAKELAATLHSLRIGDVFTL